MRRVTPTLAILLVVVVAGMTALVLLVNPNDFRAYMVQQVEQRSGYRLDLHGDLRWHVWPQMSILSGRMSLTAPGAAQPVVSAENMRLDVNLWPLLSHQLSVSQVMLKNAVVRVTPDSAEKRPQNVPQGPRNAEPPSPSDGWSFNIGQLKVADSLVIWQQAGGDEYNFRDFNLNLEQDDHKQATITLSTNLTRNQRNATVKVKGALDASQYPHRLSGQIDQLDYTLAGADIQPQGIKGSLSFQGSWNGDKQQFAVTGLQLTANDSSLSGEAEGSLAEPPRLALNLHATSLNLDNLMVNAAKRIGEGEQHATVARAPVIAEAREQSNADSPLKTLDLALKLRADSAEWRGLTLNNLQLDASNQQGLMQLNTLKGALGAGSFSVPGTVDIRQPETRVTLQPELQQVAIQPLLNALGLPESLQGTVSLSGQLSGENLSVEAAKKDWQGRAAISAENLRLAQINLQQMVRRAVARVSNRVSSEEDDEQGIKQIAGQVALNHGELTFDDLNGHGTHLALQGKGKVDLQQQQLDVTLGLKFSGWSGDDKLVAALTDQAIPLRMFGNWNNVQYTLPVDEVLRNRLQNEAKSRLNEWIDRQQEMDSRRDMKTLLRP
ncbi:MAG: outer membrane assembly protein AsmA [Enterobacterales bacterium endosymbiont of Blomia tropicalis]|uniref:outer membrane assembly protein AsmA n=1 Tax=Mixta mediterraneensis TaxID=2758443 RepID=UPI0025A7149E|nr:outer membrane assembly protein AsmA [Mixta mediterraneensis]MDL4914036.1 outer membrane assembly protein AsmA [Mixta mediterraneensis]